MTHSKNQKESQLLLEQITKDEEQIKVRRWQFDPHLERCVHSFQFKKMTTHGCQMQCSKCGYIVIDDFA